MSLLSHLVRSSVRTYVRDCYNLLCSSGTLLVPQWHWLLMLLDQYTRVPGLPIRVCAKSFNNRAQMCAHLSAIDVTAKTFFEHLYLVLGLQKIAPWVNCSYASTTLIIQCTTISRFLCNFFPRTAPQFFSIMIHQVIWPSPGTLSTARSVEDATRNGHRNEKRNPIGIMKLLF